MFSVLKSGFVNDDCSSFQGSFAACYGKNNTTGTLAIFWNLRLLKRLSQFCASRDHLIILLSQPVSNCLKVTLDPNWLKCCAKLSQHCNYIKLSWLCCSVMISFEEIRQNEKYRMVSVDFSRDRLLDPAIRPNWTRQWFERSKTRPIDRPEHSRCVLTCKTTMIMIMKCSAGVIASTAKTSWIMGIPPRQNRSLRTHQCFHFPLRMGGGRKIINN